MENDKSKFKVEFKKRLYAFTLRLIEFIDALPADNVSRRLGDQLLRSGTSIIGNYVEGQSASSKKDFTNCFNTSLKSCNESKLWLALLRDTQGPNIIWLIFSFRNSMKSQRFLPRAISLLKGRGD